MRFLSFIILMVLPYAAFAQESPPAKTPVPGTTQPAEKPSVSLDALFSDLRTETNRASGRRIAQEIRSQWSRSGSATVDLLMIWAADAMQAEKNILAEDLLTQSIVLMPNYAEAWNRRATLYYAIGRIGDSVADIERVLELEPRHFGALSGLGMILQQTSQDRKALEIWRRVLAIYPSSEQAQKAVIELEQELAGQDA
jgi:tetratricopeptide (TPR) repeat protein